MKSNVAKLLKISSVVGIFAASTAAPISLVSMYVFSNKSLSDSNGNDSNTNPEDGSIIPKLKSSINLSGPLDKIYNSQNASEANDWIAQEIKTNLDLAFENSEELKSVTDLNILINGDFLDSSSWDGNPYDGNNGWSSLTKENQILYSASLEQLNVSSLTDLKNQLTDSKIKEILNEYDSSKLNWTAEYSVKNKPGFTRQQFSSY
ncbi:P35 family lipoprotein [Malacoplasma penetrans]|uniref:Signal-peptide-less P35 lipoprotein homolog n=1 Tax=Malacoplasma penetrans (strain HF-2) TaxID=272633 RepID=Q8EV64_MALP2|nr:P35 family lipoprotein [Malacoplasma penetrans]BAC44496.1 signal-peptide-less P35 lipoprotein homolog [Malacoplasma penetrans HF-2]